MLHMRLECVEQIRFDFSAAIILVEDRQYFPRSIRGSAQQIVDLRQECALITGAGRQRIEPFMNRALVRTATGMRHSRVDR
jgi:hypothetical protein